MTGLFLPIKILRRSIFFIFFFSFVVTYPVFSQKTINYRSGYMEGFKKDGAEIKKLADHVEFFDRSTTMYCDSAYFYENEDIDAFGSIRIVPKDGATTLTGKLMHYKAIDRVAEITGDVVLVDDKATLTTNSIFYNLKTGIANYPTQGTIINGMDHIVSDLGSYDKNKKLAHFKKNVLVTNPQGIVRTDTMNYNTNLKTAYFLGPTNIIGNDHDSVYCEKGWYNTTTGISLFHQNARLKSKEQIINSDSLYYEKLTGIGKAYRNTVIIDTTQNILICGDYALYNRTLQSAVVTKKALMIQVDKKDSLFLHADTIRSGIIVEKTDLSKKVKTEELNDDSLRRNKIDTLNINKTKLAKTKRKAKDNKRNVTLQKNETQDTDIKQNAIIRTDTFKFVKAYHHVKFFRSDLQGKCDSMFYSFKDSILQFINQPVLWTGTTQLTAEHIELLTKNQKIDRLEMTNAAFMISKVDTIRYQQIKGRKMTGYFNKQNELYKMYVKGNGQTIYFAFENDDLMGVKKTESSEITLHLKQQKLSKITFINTVSGTFYPPRELSGNDLKLKDFIWLENLRPVKPTDVFEWKN